jgi:hypothetical protein
MAKPPKNPDRLEEPISGEGNGGSEGAGRSGDHDRPDGTSRHPLHVQLAPSSGDPLFRAEVALWEVIRCSTERLAFKNYARFMDQVLCPSRDSDRERGPHEPRTKRDAPFHRHYSAFGTDAYDLVKGATDLYLMTQCGRLSDLEWFKEGHRPLDPESIQTIRNEYFTTSIDGHEIRITPYYQLVLEQLRNLPIKTEFCLGTGPAEYGILRGRIEPVTMELIWSYWLEQGMLVQTMNAIALRFQNKRDGGLANPLTNLAIDPIRPLDNLCWGYIQAEPSRLTVPRRAYEYEQQYGLTLAGAAVPQLQPVERRSKFIECFHNLLHECMKFFLQRDDLTVRADGFPLLNSIADVHQLLAEGANNQAFDLTWTARVEMMIMQWLLARPEFRDFLGGRIMVRYAEAWMDRVDTMRGLQGWGDTSITSFHYLAVYGEQLLATVRNGNWSEIHDANTAAAWADHHRAAIQTYAHHYRQVTGVDLGAAPVDARNGHERYLQPSWLLMRRIAHQRGRALPPAAARSGVAARLRRPDAFPVRRLTSTRE